MTTAPLEICLRENELAMSGVDVTRTGLRWDGVPTESTVANVARFLHVARSVIDWGEADYIPQMVRIQLTRTHRKRRDDVDQEQLEMRVVTEFAALSGRDAAQLHERDKVGRFFSPEMRFDDLTYQHHVEAFTCCNGEHSKAVEWLTIASQQKLDVPALRAHIRKEARKAASGDVAQGSEYIDVQANPEVANLDLFAARLGAYIRKLGPKDAVRELRAMSNVVALVHELERRAQQAA
jgi:hypothetical protein